jgi:hypothetical protein
VADINEYSYSYKRPRPNRIEMWEVGLPNGHRLILKVRRSRIIVPPNHLAYQAKCTCKGWASDTWHRSQVVARRDFQEHIGNVEKQGNLL